MNEQAVKILTLFKENKISAEQAVSMYHSLQAADGKSDPAHYQNGRRHRGYPAEKPDWLDMML